MLMTIKSVARLVFKSPITSLLTRSALFVCVHFSTCPIVPAHQWTPCTSSSSHTIGLFRGLYSHCKHFHSVPLEQMSQTKPPYAPLPSSPISPTSVSIPSSLPSTSKAPNTFGHDRQPSVQLKIEASGGPPIQSRVCLTPCFNCASLKLTPVIDRLRSVYGYSAISLISFRNCLLYYRGSRLLCNRSPLFLYWST